MTAPAPATRPTNPRRAEKAVPLGTRAAAAAPLPDEAAALALALSSQLRFSIPFR